MSNAIRSSTRGSAILPRWLSAGDLLVVNTSGTLNAAVSARTRSAETSFELHLSTRLPAVSGPSKCDSRAPLASLPYRHALRGNDVRAAGRWTRSRLLAPYPLVDPIDAASRLWIAAVQLPCAVRPVSRRAWLSDSIRLREAIVAGLDVSDRVRDRARQRGDAVGRATVHAGARDPARLAGASRSRRCSSTPASPAWRIMNRRTKSIYRVPRQTAERVNAARRAGHRVIAVGTTVVRALETVTDASGTTVSRRGLDGPRGHRRSSAAVGERLDLRLSRAARRRICRCSKSVSGRRHLERAYGEARRLGYLWHEFGDSHLILGRATEARRGPR